MMPEAKVRILAVDSSSMSGSVALSHGSTPVAEVFLQVGKTHSEILLEQIDRLIAQAGWTAADLDLLAAVTGPGSFTGLRIGVATIKGLAQALNKPVVGVSSLQAVAMNLPLVHTPVCAFLDARKKEVYAQLFNWQGDEPVPQEQARVLPPDMLLKELSGRVAFAGSGVLLYRRLIVDRLAERALLPPPCAHQIKASQVAWLALKQWSRQSLLRPAELMPTYVRPSDAELNLRPA
jgi:tRNA threonylcarbamoyladenosine biosynthesis protein TsaB